MSWWLSASMLSRCSDMLKLVNIFPLFHVQDHVDFWNKPHQYAQQKLISFSYLAWIQVHQQGFSHLSILINKQVESLDLVLLGDWSLNAHTIFQDRPRGTPSMQVEMASLKLWCPLSGWKTEAKVVLSDWRVACHIQIASCRTKGLGPS